MSRSFKRFYKAVAVAREGQGYGVTLDSKPIVTPQGARLTLPTQAGAGLIAEEWDSQGEQVQTASLPLTRLANVAQDRMHAAREATADMLASYAETDVLCHRAEQPENLVRQQFEQWNPVLDWAKEYLDVSLGHICGIQPATHSEDALERVRSLALEQDDFRLTALAHAAALLTSSILAFGLLKHRFDADTAYELAALEEKFQQSQWGVDEEAQAREDEIRFELRALERFLKAL